jgi:hypothetical protein
MIFGKWMRKSECDSLLREAFVKYQVLTQQMESEGQDHDSLVNDYRGLLERYDSLSDELEEARETAAELQAKLDAFNHAHEPVTSEVMDKAVKSRCLHCGGAHIISCPRLKRIRYKADGQTPAEVEYFPDFTWPPESIFWPEEHSIIDFPS